MATTPRVTCRINVSSCLSFLGHGLFSCPSRNTLSENSAASVFPPPSFRLVALHFVERLLSSNQTELFLLLLFFCRYFGLVAKRTYPQQHIPALKLSAGKQLGMPDNKPLRTCFPLPTQQCCIFFSHSHKRTRITASPLASLCDEGMP